MTTQSPRMAADQGDMPMTPAEFASRIAQLSDAAFDAYLVRLREAGLLTPAAGVAA